MILDLGLDQLSLRIENVQQALLVGALNRHAP
jgi:hypothetical protein